MINLGDKKWGVKDSGLLAYKQVGSKFFNKDFDFTRSSDATYIDKNGVLQTQSLYNLLPYSNVFNTWTFDDVTRTDGHIGYNGFSNAWLIQYNTTASRHNINRSVSFSGSGTFSVYAKAKELQYIQIASAQTTEEYANFDLSDGSIGNVGNRFTNVQAIPVGNDWYRLSVTTANGYNFIYISIVTSKTAVWLESFSGANSTDGLYIQDAQLVEGTEPLDYQYTNGRVGIPRIDFSDGVGSLLLEGQRTNLVTYSANINAYLTSQVDVTITYEYDISPDGTLNSSRVEFADSTAFAYRAVTISSEHTASIYVKGTAGETIMFGFGANVTVGSIYTFTGEWQRLTFTATSGAVIFLSTYGGATARDFEAFGLQLEAGSYATSYIKSNSGSATTRTADLANNCGTEQDFNSEEGVLYAEISGFENDLSNRRISLSDGTANNSIRIFYYNDGGTVFFRKYVGGVQTSIVTINSINQHEITKIAIKYNSTNFDIFANGVKISTNLDSNSFPTNTLNKIGFADSSGGTPFYGNAKQLIIFPTALTDAQLAELTTL